MKYPKICFHVGLHKTASTYLQENLTSAINEESLKNHGIKVYGPDTLRENDFIFHLRKSILERDGQEHFNEFKNLCESLSNDTSCERILFTDENMIGSCADTFRKYSIYPQMKSLLGQLALSFPSHPHEIFICLRKMSGYLSSAYIETLRHSNKFFEFEDCLKKIDSNEMSWSMHIDWIKESFPNSRICVWEFEKLNQEGYLRKIMRSLLDVDIYDKIHFNDIGIRKSFPMKALEILKMTKDDLNPMQFKSLRRLLDNPSIEWQNPVKFSPVEGELKEDLDTRHEDLIRRLNDDPQIELL